MNFTYTNEEKDLVVTEKSPLTDAQTTFINKVAFRSITAEHCSLDNALARTAYKDVLAPMDSPPYHRAIVEGFLVQTKDTKGASDQTPIRFQITGEVKPGESQCPIPQDMQAIRVSTGSIVPEGEFSIVRMWEAEISGQSFQIKRSFPARFFIENRGCDIEKNTMVCSAGTTLSAMDIGTLASLGITEVSVATKPTLSIFSSGDEVIPYTAPFQPGKIYDCNSMMLSAAAHGAGAIPTFKGIMNDDFKQFVKQAKQALNTSDMLLISGGTAVGGKDFISDLIREIGELIIDGVPMRSGRPLIMGIANQKPIVCVAGHPPEALRGFQLFAVPTIQKLMGIDVKLPEDRPSQA